MELGSSWIELGNEMNLWCMLKDNMKKFKVFKNIKSQNYAGFAYHSHVTRVKLQNMDIIDESWNKTMEY